MSTEIKKPAVAAKKGTTQTEAIIGTSAAKLSKVLSDIHDAVKSVQDLGTKSEEQTAIIAAKEERISQLDVDFAEKKRQKEVDLAVQLKADERKTVDGILREQGLKAVAVEEYSKLTGDLEKLTKSVNEEIGKAVNAATSAMKKEHENAVKLSQQEFATKEATSAAQLENLKMQNTFLAEQVESWKSALEAERNAGVERAKASSIGSVNISGAGK